MSEHEKYQRIEPISGSDPKRKIELTPPSESEEGALSKVKFDKAVELADPSKVELRQKELIAQEASSAQEAKKQSLIDLARQSTVPTKAPPTIESIESTATSIRKNIERPRALLLAVGPNAPIDSIIDPTTGNKLSPQQVEGKLSASIEHVDKTLIDVTKDVSGVEVGSLIPQDKPPLVRFLKFLTESDKKLSETVKEVNLMNQTPEKLTPPKLLSIQIRMNFIQQELEFFAGVLNKALESTKTIMNVQI
jgi:hypothetical protein